MAVTLLTVSVLKVVLAIFFPQIWDITSHFLKE